MANLDTGPLLTDIGQLIARDLREENATGAYLYGEMGDGWRAGAIFKDVGVRVIYRRPSHQLLGAIEALWDAEDPDKRWAILHYEIIDDRFNATFEYPDGVDPEEDEIERRGRFLKKRFGDKPVDYSDP